MIASVQQKPLETTPAGAVPSPDRRRETGVLAVNRALAVVIVAHNEAETLQPTIDRVYRALTITIEDFSMIVFDDGSTDDTAAKAEAAAQQYPFVRILRNERQMGVGYCTMQASRVAEAEFIAYVPGDNTWPLRSFIELFGHLGKADIITSYSNNLLAAMPWPKRIASRAYTGILNLVFRKGMRYYNGLTIYPVSYFAAAPVRSRGFGFQAEALIKAIAAGYSFLEIALPVDVQNLPRARSVTVSNAFDAALTILRIGFRFQVLRRVPLRSRSLLRVSSRQSADEIGVAETAHGHPVQAGQETKPMRVVICGASSGIGARLARALADEGHHLFICARRADRLEAVKDGSEKIDTFICDVADKGQVEAFAAGIAAKTDAVDVLINCAGGFGEIAPIGSADSDRWWQTLEVNLKGVYLSIQCMLPLLSNGHQPRVINFAGGGAFSPFPNYSAYACSKTAIVRLTECLAAELAPANIRVNAIAPGFVPTEMHQATLRAGEDRAGRLQFQRTQAILNQGAPSMENVVNCVKALMSPALDEFTGKTVSSNFDPWQTEAFRELMPDIVRSDLYTLRRVNIVNLPDGRLRSRLSQPW
jgi:NAD(P)-dependent dehydrogenase (short-subunit alcohol dehydrogenase family)